MKAEKKKERLTRRNFLKTAAASAGAAALAGVGSREAGAAQQSQVPKWDYEAGIVVLGIGGAGLISAIAARDLGSRRAYSREGIRSSRGRQHQGMHAGCLVSAQPQ